MNKKVILSTIVAVIMSLAYFTYNTNNVNNTDSNLAQIGGALVYDSCMNEGRAAEKALGGISTATGVGILLKLGGQAGATIAASAAITPLGWAAIGIGLII